MRKSSVCPDGGGNGAFLQCMLIFNLDKQEVPHLYAIDIGGGSMSRDSCWISLH